jgi:HlyD family secretion protein
MKRLLSWIIIIGIIVGVGAGGYGFFHWSGHKNATSVYRTATVKRGDIRLVVTSTGTVKPVSSVEVGTFVSGPIQKVLVDFNARVKAGQLLAQIDPRIYKAALAHENATLAHARADLTRVTALLEQAKRTEQRALMLKPNNAIAETDFDQSVTDRKAAEAQIDLAKATIEECEANLATAKTNLDFTDIQSPVDGIVIDRKVDPGQTVASQFQTPVLFVVAPDLEKNVYVYASVDEADIGLIREAQKRKEPVSFAVDAYPRDTFTGVISQVRLNPTTVQNVVTYTVVVEASNRDLKLLPGMTANVSFQIEKHTGVLTIPNAATRFHPKADQVRPDDRALLDDTADDGSIRTDVDAPKEKDSAGGVTAAALAAQGAVRRCVWIVKDDTLAAVPIVTGLSDKHSTELTSGGLTEGQELVVGVQTTTAK